MDREKSVSLRGFWVPPQRNIMDFLERLEDGEYKTHTKYSAFQCIGKRV